MKQILVHVFLTFACIATCVALSELSWGIIRHKLCHSMDIRSMKSDSDVARRRRKRWDSITFSVTEEQAPPQRLATASKRLFCSCWRDHPNAAGFCWQQRISTKRGWRFDTPENIDKINKWSFVPTHMTSAFLSKSKCWNMFANQRCAWERNYYYQ